jgi:hypothetical protein
MSLKNSNDTIGNRTRDLPVYSLKYYVISNELTEIILLSNHYVLNERTQNHSICPSVRLVFGNKVNKIDGCYEQNRKHTKQLGQMTASICYVAV